MVTFHKTSKLNVCNSMILVCTGMSEVVEFPGDAVRQFLTPVL